MMLDKINQKINLAVLLCTAIFLSTACTNKPASGIVQRADHWIILEHDDSRKVDGTLSWDFTVNRPGQYDVQIISEGEQTSFSSDVNIRVADMQLNKTLDKIFAIEEKGEKLTVFQFKNNIHFKQAGKYTLEIQTDAAFKKIRIIPTYRKNLGFGSGKYSEEWSAMHHSPEKQATLEWFKEARYGMFIHWGIYSRAAGSWNGITMEDGPFPGPNVAEWLMYKFRIPRAEYEKLADQFHPDKSFAVQIARLAKAAGMKYVVITAKHHDGFAMFDSECSDYDIVDRTPYKADAIKQLYNACLDEGLKFGVYYSHGHDWTDGTDGNYSNVKKMNDSIGILTSKAGKNLWDPSPNTFSDYLENKAYPQIQELLKSMPKLSIVWFDGEGLITEEQAFQFYKLIYDLNPGVIVNRRVGYDFADYLDAGDNVIPSASDNLQKHWETCGTTNNSWAYKAYDHDWKSTKETLYYLVDIASKGGNYLLNIGPDGRGHVPEPCSSILREIGQWLETNGEAIYGTSRWVIPHEGQGESQLNGTGHRASKGFSRNFSSKDFWFTTKGKNVYAISLVNPQGEIEIKSLKTAKGKIKKVSLLGSSAKLKWEQNDNALIVDLPDIPSGKYGYALEISL